MLFAALIVPLVFQSGPRPLHQDPDGEVRPTCLRIPLPPVVSHDYASGEQRLLQAEQIWRPLCSADRERVDPSQLVQMIGAHRAALDGPVTVVDSGVASLAGLNLVFHVHGNVPAKAPAALAAVELYLEQMFTDSIKVQIDVTFQVLDPNVLGGAASSYVNSTYPAARNGLQSDLDADDVLQDWLPGTSTCPVRYGSSATVTAETRVFFTYANYKAAIGTVSGTAADMTFNKDFKWDWDPTDGVVADRFSFRDIVVHEVGHALGFTSGGDFRVKDMEALDLFRFQRTDGNHDWNPDGYFEFKKRPRLVAFNKPDDNHNCDLILLEMPMSDGNPHQMSHFRAEVPELGIMDPWIAAGTTAAPNYLMSNDLQAFDAIGYDL